MHDELKRMRRVIERGLRDWWVYRQFEGRSLSDMIFQDVLGEVETVSEEEVTKIVKYVEGLRDKMGSGEVRGKIAEGKFRWEEIHGVVEKWN